MIDEKVFLQIFLEWTQSVVKNKAEEEIKVRGSVEEGWVDIDIENEKYLAGGLINSESIYDLRAIDKKNNKVYDKMEFFTTPEQLKFDLDAFYSHFRANSLDQFLKDITVRK